MQRVEKIGKTGFVIEEIFRPVEFMEPFRRVVIPEFNRTLFSGIAFEAEFIRSLRAEQAEEQSRTIEQILGPDAIPEPEDLELPPGIHVDLSPQLRRKFVGVLKQRSVGVWRQVGPTLRDQLERTIIRSLDNGDTFKVMTKKIEKKLQGLKRVQPAAIARTETTLLYNSGAFLEREELQIPSSEWISTIDPDNRGFEPKSQFDHVKPDGQVTANAEPFEVSGEFLRFPADGSLGASAGNIVNCRCSAGASLATTATRISPEPPTPVQPQPRPTPSLTGNLDSTLFVDEADEAAKGIDTLESRIFHRIENNAALKEKHKRVVDFAKKRTEEADDLARQIDSSKTTIKRVSNESLREVEGTPRKEELRNQLQKEIKKLKRLNKQQKKFGSETAKSVSDLLAVPDELSVSIENPAVPTGLKRKHKEAKEFVQKLTSEKSRDGSLEQTIKVRKLKGRERAFARPDNNSVHLSQESDVGIHVHEIGHILEDKAKNGKQIAQFFRQRRVNRAGTENRRMNEALNTNSYGPNEIGNEDEFLKAFNGDLNRALYTGKSYPEGWTEIISMGIEELYKNPFRFASQDPEYFKFIVGFLDGTFAVGL